MPCAPCAWPGSLPGRMRLLSGRHVAERCCCVARAEPVQQQFRVRQATLSDADAVAELCAEVFGPATWAGLVGWPVPTSGQVQRASQDLQRDVATQLSKSLRAKQEARRQAREVRLLQLNAAMRAELDRLAGRPTLSSLPSSPLQRQAQRRWRRTRQFACLVAEPLEGGGPLAGCAVVSLAAPEALLPPPWPSRAPLRCCVSNVAVAAGSRRRGAARQLLEGCERLARRWGHEDVWLHTETRNRPALALYSAAGYAERARDPALFGPFRRVLLRKPLPPTRACRPPPEQRIESGGSSGGTYVWNVRQE